MEEVGTKNPTLSAPVFEIPRLWDRSPLISSSCEKSYPSIRKAKESGDSHFFLNAITCPFLSSSLPTARLLLSFFLSFFFSVYLPPQAGYVNDQRLLGTRIKGGGKKRYCPYLAIRCIAPSMFSLESSQGRAVSSSHAFSPQLTIQSTLTCKTCLAV